MATQAQEIQKNAKKKILPPRRFKTPIYRLNVTMYCQMRHISFLSSTHQQLMTWIKHMRINKSHKLNTGSKNEHF